MTDTTTRRPNPSLHSLRYDVDSLVVVLALGDQPYVEIQFDPPRAFRSYAESDFGQYLAAYKGEPLLVGGDADIGIFMSEDAPYVVEYRKNVRPSAPETTYSCLIATEQECVEVVCFEKPTIRLV